MPGTERSDTVAAEQFAAQAAYISGQEIQSLVFRLEDVHCLTLSAETIATIHRQARLILEPIVQQALAQEAAVHA